jgi:hypothetical protein
MINKKLNYLCLLVLYVKHLIFVFVQDQFDMQLNVHLMLNFHIEVFHNYEPLLIIHFQLFLNVVHVRNILHWNIDDLFHRNEDLVEFDEDDL